MLYLPEYNAGVLRAIDVIDTMTVRGDPLLLVLLFNTSIECNAVHAKMCSVRIADLLLY